MCHSRELSVSKFKWIRGINFRCLWHFCTFNSMFNSYKRNLLRWIIYWTNVVSCILFFSFIHPLKYSVIIEAVKKYTRLVSGGSKIVEGNSIGLYRIHTKRQHNYPGRPIRRDLSLKKQGKMLYKKELKRPQKSYHIEDDLDNTSTGMARNTLKTENKTITLNLILENLNWIFC